jgi:predicted NBD/HSP70 family sugar kinase
MEGNYIGIDVGGTNIRIGLVSKEPRASTRGIKSQILTAEEFSLHVGDSEYSSLSYHW